MVDVHVCFAVQNRIHEAMLQDVERRRKRQEIISKRTKAQQWGVTSVDEAVAEVDAFVFSIVLLSNFGHIIIRLR